MPLSPSSHVNRVDQTDTSDSDDLSINQIFLMGAKSSDPFEMQMLMAPTDLKPLIAILEPKKGVPTLAAARLQRWVVLLSAYNYQVQYSTSLSASTTTQMPYHACPYLSVISHQSL